MTTVEKTNNSLNKNKVIGIIGGGQLGKLLIEESDPKLRDFINITYKVYSPEIPLFNKDDNMYYTFQWIKGDLQNEESLINFCNQCDVVTIEIENINVNALHHVNSRAEKPVPIYPSPTIIEIVQNKKTQKEFFQKHNFPTAKFISYQELSQEISKIDDKIDALEIELPIINKLQVGGYDGRGVKKVYNYDELFTYPSIIEETINIKQELSVIVARNNLGQTVTYDPVDMFFNDKNMLDYLSCPSNLDHQTTTHARNLATAVANTLELVGIMAVEMFLTTDGKLLINELAPRPHNSGHHTLNCYDYSQFDLLIRCLLNLPLFQPQNTNHGNITLMVNVLGHQRISMINGQELDSKAYEVSETFQSSTFKLYDYKKSESFPNRKMGHITYNTNLSYPLKTPLNNISDLDSLSTWMKASIRYGFDKKRHQRPVVGIIMGSDSDLPVLHETFTILTDFMIPHEIKVISAHRTPTQMITYAQTAEQRGFKVIIAAAGGAAHLPGMVASVTTLPVIGVPIKSTNSINGLDSLLSIVQMPGGIPVATMAINGAKNAGLMAVRILSIGDQRLKNLLQAYQSVLENKVDQMNQSLNSNSE